MTTLATAALICAAIPALLFMLNLYLYRPPAAVPEGAPAPGVSVLIPARNEEAAVAAAVRSVLASAGVSLEVIVMDDSSTDRTADVVLDLAREDARVRLERAPALPPGWNGKQHACWALAHAARFDTLCFLDADVRLEPAALARMAHFRVASRSALVSGFPRQITGTWLERLLLPLIHFVLLGFLPIAGMRRTTWSAFAAGCGQLLLVDRAAYFVSRGHAAIRETMHDGLRLPRQLRSHGYRTDLADITDLATCRMYTSAGQVWQGLAKNATEGIAAPARIVPFTLFLLAGQVLPFVLAAWSLLLVAILIFFKGLVTPVDPPKFDMLLRLSLAAAAAAWLPRILGGARFKQSLFSAILHPIGILVLLVLQWYALLRSLRGGPVRWRDRTYSR